MPLGMKCINFVLKTRFTVLTEEDRPFDLVQREFARFDREAELLKGRTDRSEHDVARQTLLKGTGANQRLTPAKCGDDLRSEMRRWLRT